MAVSIEFTTKGKRKRGGRSREVEGVEETRGKGGKTGKGVIPLLKA